MTKQPLPRFALDLRRYRKIKREGLTQRALADELGIDQITVSRYERGVSYPLDEWIAHKIETLTGVVPPRTREELSAQLEDALRASKGPGASRDALGEASE